MTHHRVVLVCGYNNQPIDDLNASFALSILLEVLIYCLVHSCCDVLWRESGVAVAGYVVPKPQFAVAISVEVSVWSGGWRFRGQLCE